MIYTQNLLMKTASKFFILDTFVKVELLHFFTGNNTGTGA